MEPTTQQSSSAIPIAIIVGFALIALAIFFSNNSEPVPPAVDDITKNEEAVTDAEVPPINAEDYVKGNPNAPIVIIEYSDYECPFCKQFHTTMNQIMDEFGINGQVAWVYRQFPLVQLHPNSSMLSEAALCVGDIGGNEAFWKFTDRIFSDRDISAPVNVTRLPTYAEEAGVDITDYLSCMSSGRMEEDVMASLEEGFNIGARGTPYTIIMVGDQEAVIDGAQPYEVVNGIITNLLQQIEGSVQTNR
jgi:protein-disulfide isomerase